MRGWCPFAVRRPTNNFGYPQGATGTNKPLMFCDHTMGGWKRTLDDATWREPNGVGVHFGIGMDGSKSQYTNIFDASWGNGVSGSIAGYDRKNRHLGALEKAGQWKQVGYAGTIAYALVGPGGNLPNTHTISIEHEDGGKPDPIWTPSMLQASIEIKQWCLEELAREGMPMVVDADALIGHFQIDAVNRAHCPGMSWPKSAQLAALIKPQEEEMKSFLAWDITNKRVVFVGPGGVKWITKPVTVAELEKQFGKMEVALTADALAAIG